MLKKFIAAALMISALFAFAAPALAISYTTNSKTVTATTKPTATASPSPSPTPVDPFSLFWPMVAGRTADSKIYFLKTLKENIRGMLIFGKAQKADYQVFLTIKRVLEADALLSGGKTDLANQTLDNAANDLDQAKTNFDAAKSDNSIPQNVKDETNIRLSNLKKFLAFLIAKDSAGKDKLQNVLNKVGLISL